MERDNNLPATTVLISAISQLLFFIILLTANKSGIGHKIGLLGIFQGTLYWS